MAADSISLGELEVSNKILTKQLKQTEKDIVAFQKRIDKILKWDLKIDDSKLRRTIGRAVDEFDRLERKATRTKNQISTAFERSLPNLESIAAKQSAAIGAIYQKTIEQSKAFAAQMIGETAKVRAAMPNVPRQGTTRQPKLDPTASADLLKAQENVLKAQSTAREIQETKNRRMILAAEKNLSNAKIALFKQEIVEINRALAARLQAVKGEASKEIAARTDAARQIAAKERQMQAETRRNQNRGKQGVVGRARFAEDITTITQGLQSGSIAGIAAMFGPMGAAAGAAFDTIVSGAMAATNAANEFNDQIRSSESLLVGNNKSISQLGDAHQALRFSARETGVALSDTQTVFNQMLGSVPALGNDMNALASLTDKVSEAAVGMNGSAKDIASGMTSVANSFGLALTEEENQVFILDAISRLTVDGVTPNIEQMSDALGKGATNFAALSTDAKSGISALGAFNAVLTLNGINIQVAQDKINDFSRELLDMDQRTKLVKMGMEGIDKATGKVSDWGKLFESMSKDTEKFAGAMKGVNSAMLVRMFSKEGGAQIKEMLANQQEAMGTSQAMFTKNAESAKTNMDRLKTEWNDLLVTMGEGASNSSKGIAGSMASALSWINDLMTSAEALNLRAQEQLKVAKKANEDIEHILSMTENLKPESFLEVVKSQMLQLEALSPAIAGNIETMLNATNAASPENISKIREQMEMIATIKAAESVTALNEAVKKSGDAMKATSTIGANELKSQSTITEGLSGSPIGDMMNPVIKLFGGDTESGQFDIKAVGESIRSEMKQIETAMIAIGKLPPAKLADPEMADAIEQIRDRYAALQGDLAVVSAKEAENNALIQQGLNEVLEKNQNIADQTNTQVNLTILRQQMEAQVKSTIAEGNSQREVAYDLINQTINSLQSTQEAETEIDALLKSQSLTCEDINTLTDQQKQLAITTIEAYIAQQAEQMQLLIASKQRLKTEQATLEAMIGQAAASGDIVAAVQATAKLTASKITEGSINQQMANTRTQLGVGKSRLAELKGETKATKDATNAVNDLSDAEDEATSKGRGGASARTKALKEEENEAKKIAKEKEDREKKIADALEKINADRYQSETKRKAAGLDETEAKLYEEERRYQDQLADLRKEFGEHSGLMAAATALHLENIAGIEEDAMLKAKEKAEELEKEKAEHRKEVSDKIVEMEKANADAEFEIREAQVAREVKAEADKYTELLKMAKKYGGDVQAIEKLRFQGIMRIYRQQITEMTTSIAGTYNMIFPKSALVSGAEEFDRAKNARIGSGSDTAQKLAQLQMRRSALNDESLKAQKLNEDKLLAERETEMLGAQRRFEEQAFRISLEISDSAGTFYEVINGAMREIFGENGFTRITKDTSALLLQWKQELDAKVAEIQKFKIDYEAANNTVITVENMPQELKDLIGARNLLERRIREAGNVLARRDIMTKDEQAQTDANAVLRNKIQELQARLQGMTVGAYHGQTTAESEAMKLLIDQLRKANEEYEAQKVKTDALNPTLEKNKTILAEIRQQEEDILNQAPADAIAALVANMDNWLSKLALVINEHKALSAEIKGINQQYDNLTDEDQGDLDEFYRILDARKRALQLTRESGTVLGGDISTSEGIRTNYRKQVTNIAESIPRIKELGEIGGIDDKLIADMNAANGKIWAESALEALGNGIKNVAIEFGTIVAHEIPAEHSDPAGVVIGNQISETMEDNAKNVANTQVQADNKAVEARSALRNEAKQIAMSQLLQDALALGPQGLVKILFSPEMREELVNMIIKSGKELEKVQEQFSKESSKLFDDALKLIKNRAKQVQLVLDDMMEQSRSRIGSKNQLQTDLDSIARQSDMEKAALLERFDSSNAKETELYEFKRSLESQLASETNEAERERISNDIKLTEAKIASEHDSQLKMQEVLNDIQVNSAEEVRQAWVKAATRFMNDMTQFIKLGMDFVEHTIETVRTASKEGDFKAGASAFASITSELTSGFAEIASKFGPMGEMIGGAVGAVGGLFAGIAEMLGTLFGGDMKLTDLEQATRENARVNAMLEARKSLMADLVALGDLQLDTTREQAKFLADSLAQLESGKFGAGNLTNEQISKRSAGSQQRIAGLQYELVQAQRNAEEAPLFDRAYWEDYADSLTEAIAMEQLNSDSLTKQVELRKELRGLILKTLQDEANARDIRAAAGIEAYTSEKAARENLKALNELIQSAKNGTAMDVAGNKANFTPDEIAQMQADAERYRTQAEDARRSRQEFDREVLKHQQEMTGKDTSKEIEDSLKAQIAQEKSILATLHGQDQIIEQKKVIMGLEKQLLDLQKSRGNEMDKELALLTKQREAILAAARADKSISSDEKSQLLDIQARIRARLLALGTDPTEVDRIMSNMNLQAFESGGWVEGAGAVPVIAHGGERVLSRAEIAGMGGRSAIDSLIASRYATLRPNVGNYAYSASQSFGNVNISGTSGEDIWRQLEPRLRRSWAENMRNHEKSRGGFRG